ncbi:MAG: glycosyltransferase [bacterium]
MKIALVHDHLAQDGGAERVLKTLKEMFPQAPIFTLIYDKKNTGIFFKDTKINTSFLQRIPTGISHYQWWLGLMPMAIESLDLMKYDVIISSASSFAKGVLTRPDSVHICYCHTPTRYLWLETHNYIRTLRVNPLIKALLPMTLKRLRLWDYLSANRVDMFLANSWVVKERIKKYYQRESQVIYPPVEIDDFFISPHPKKFFLAGGRLVPYKRLDLVIKAFSRLGVPLKIFGVGPELKYLKKIASDNIEFLGRVSDKQKKWLYANCIAYLHPQEEDFGITAVEAMASGRPVIAYKAGGATETVIEGITGEFFDDQWWEDIADQIIRFDEKKYNPEKIREHAKKFHRDAFVAKMSNIINQVKK